MKTIVEGDDEVSLVVESIGRVTATVKDFREAEGAHDAEEYMIELQLVVDS